MSAKEILQAGLTTQTVAGHRLRPLVCKGFMKLWCLCFLPVYVPKDGLGHTEFPFHSAGNQAQIEYAGGKKTYEEHFLASKEGGEIFTYKAVK